MIANASESGILTHSRMACARTCLRKHYFAYELGIRKDRSSQPLRLGAAVHVGLDLLAQGKTTDEAVQTACADYEVVPDWVQEVEEWMVEREIVARIITGYAWRWSKDEAEVVATEIEFDLPIRNPETGRETPTFRVAGKIDKIIRRDGRLMVREHKTCGQDISAGSDYWQRLRLDQQISLYMLAARTLGHEVVSVEYDVIRKPSIRPKKLTKSESALTGCERETVEMFGERFTNDIAARPEFYFARVEIPRLEADLIEFEHELWAQQLQIRDCQKTGRWFRNTAACLAPFACEYLPICANNIDPAQGVPTGYVQLSWTHPELSNRENDND